MDQVLSVVTKGGEVEIMTAPPRNDILWRRGAPLVFGARLDGKYHPCHIVVADVTIEGCTCKVTGTMISLEKRPEGLDIPQAPASVLVIFSDYDGFGRISKVA